MSDGVPFDAASAASHYKANRPPDGRGRDVLLSGAFGPGACSVLWPACFVELKTTLLSDKTPGQQERLVWSMYFWRDASGALWKRWMYWRPPLRTKAIARWLEDETEGLSDE